MASALGLSLEYAVNESYRQFLQQLQVLNDAKTNSQLIEVLNRKDANSAYVILYSLRKIYKRDLFNGQFLGSLTHESIGVDWKIVPDDEVDNDIKYMIGGLISVTQFNDYCMFIGALQYAYNYENMMTSDMDNLPVSLNSYLYLLPPNVDSIQLGQVASLFVNDAVIGEIAPMYPYLTKFAARNRKLLTMSQMPQLLELREVGLLPVDENGQPMVYDFYGKFPPGLVLLELQAMGRFDPYSLLYAGDDSGASALVYLESLLINMSVGKEEANAYQNNLIDAANYMGISASIGVYPVGTSDYISGATLTNPTSKTTKLANPDGAQFVRLSGKNYTLTPQ